MDVAQWTEPAIDVVRARRLTVGFVFGAVILAGTVAFIASASPEQVEEEEELEVVFGDLPEEEEEVLPEEEEPEPEPEPPPPIDEPQPTYQGPVKAGPRAVEIDAAPDDVSDSEADEAEADPGDFGAGSDPNADPGGGGTGRVGATAPPPPPPPPPEPEPPPPKPKPKRKKKKKVTRVTEGMTPPKRISGGAPGYPASAKSQGIEGTVVVVYVVTASGGVSGVKAVRGPAALRGAAVAAVSSWRFQPAKDATGKPVSVRRIAKFPFRITTR
jgi:protein TonB